MDKKIYLDAGIFVAYFDTNDSDNKHHKVKNFLKIASKKNNVKFYVSSWALTEAIKVLIIGKEFKKEQVHDSFLKLMRVKRLGELKFDWMPSPKIKDYDLDDFFYGIQEKLLENRIGVGDIMHVVLMEISGIDSIITFNVNDFSKFGNIKAINPDDIVKYISKEVEKSGAVIENPFTLKDLISYAHSMDPTINWNDHSPAHYRELRKLDINTMTRLVGVIEDKEARKTLTKTYQRLLGRKPDWAGIFSYQPWIYLKGTRGRKWVEQSILASDEYLRNENKKE